MSENAPSDEGLVVIDPTLLADRLPRGLRNAAFSVARGRGPFGALYDRVAHPLRNLPIPELPPVPGTPIRAFVGPANEAEQGYQWARAFERLPGVGAVSMIGIDPGPYRVRADLRVPTSVYLRAGAWHDAFQRYLLGFTHVFFESNLPLLGRRHGTDVLAEARILQAQGLRTAMLFHGSDIRSPAAHALESEWSPFARAGLPVRVMEEKAARNRRHAAESGMPVFVSTPDLLRHAPGSVWCPIVVDPRDWTTDREHRRRRARPLVVHAPSNPLLKGSDEIEPLLRRMESEGLIEYRVIRGIPYAEMPAIYAEADIVLDHFLIGNYSMVTIEALAAGCLVIGHIDQPTRAAVIDATGVDVPVLEADVRSLENVLRAALADGDGVPDLLARGPEFVRQVHDGRFSASAVSAFLGVKD